jgi:ribosomal subunit interface protein
MQISVSGQHINLSNALQTHVKERVIQVVRKYFDDIINANIHFTKDAAQYICDLVLNDDTGKQIIVKNQQASNEIYSSFDGAILNLEKQLRKHKSRLKDRHNRIKVSTVPIEAVKYVINSSSDQEEAEDDNPIIIAENPTKIETLTVSEAVMMMDLKNLPALMFQNSKNGRINIVYYRKDGNISWIDSK